MAIYNKEDVLPQAEGLWDKILIDLCGIDGRIFDTRKEHPCPICAGKTRFRYIPKHDLPFFCNRCGSRSGIQLYQDLTGVDFFTAINDVGDYLNCIPVAERELINQKAIITQSFPKWYKFDLDQFNDIKTNSEIKLTASQRVNGLNELDLLNYKDKTAVPLIDSDQIMDYVLIDIDDNWMTSGGNINVCSGYYSVFGNNAGKRNYLFVNPIHAMHSAIQTGKQTICVWEENNLGSVINKLNNNLENVMCVTDLSESTMADCERLKQLTFDIKTNTLQKRLYMPFEITDLRK